MDFQYIFFDLDGTIIEPFEGITNSYQYALAHFGIHMTKEALKPCIGPPLRMCFKEICGLGPENIEAAAEKYLAYMQEKGIYQNTLYPGIDKLIAALHDHGKTVVLTSSKLWSIAKQILAHYDLEKYFAFISGSERDGSRADKGEIINHAIETLHITDLSKTVIVGDRKYDVIGAKQTGIHAIAVLYGHGSQEELAAENPDYIVSNTEELYNLLLP